MASNVWQTRHRLVLEHCNHLLSWLYRHQPGDAPELLELSVRLLGLIQLLLEQHAVNHRRQCRTCSGPSRRF